MSSRSRRRPRRRATAPLVLLALVAIAAAFLGIRAGRGGEHGGSAARAVGARDLSASAQTLVNGPTTASAAGRRPLAVKLEGTRDPVTLRFGKPPRSGLLFDLDTGAVLWRRAPTRVLPIASLTKMMTALVVTDRLAPGDKVLVTKEALAYKGSAVGVLPRGKRVGLSAMLYGLLLPSGNDAAIALAQRVSGTEAAFEGLMNARARAMGLACTHFTSPDGFVDRGNHSCAVDLAAQARAVLDQPWLARIVRRRQALLPFPVKGGKLNLFNNNPLLRARYPGTLGIKTGYTDASGRCLVAAVRRGSRRLGVLLLRSPDPGAQARKLFARGFAARQ